MTTGSAQEAHGGIRTGTPTGFRRLTPSLLAADRAAGAFDGLPEGVTLPGQLLAAFKAAAPSLGLGLRLVHAVDWLFRFTQPQDWKPGGRPIVWPSASLQQDAFGLSATRVKALNRALIEAGLVTMRDSPNGKRYGRRDKEGRIVEAYGFDLAPLAARFSEFTRVAAAARAERAEFGRLRRRATIARNGIAQLLETAAEYGFAGSEWVNLARDSRNLVQSLKRIERLEEMVLGVESLERRQSEARERLELLLAELAATASGDVNPNPKGPENGPHQYTYKPTLYPEQDTVVASEGCRSGVRGIYEPPAPVGPDERRNARPEDRTGQGRGRPERVDTGTMMQLSPKELAFLAPRLRGYLRNTAPNWREIVDAADYLRGELGVSKSLWGEACLAMGREHAAIAIAVVSAKPVTHFRSTPGGYFHGMVAKAKAGELNLARTVWGLRHAHQEPRRPSSQGSATGRAGGI
jgi:replication initiation protein RepC